MRDSMRCLRFSLLYTSIALADAAVASVNESRLWLPRAQHELKPQLMQAAQLAASGDECAEVISGELDTNRSAANAPVFRIVCRNPAGYTYSVFVTNAGMPNAKVEKVQGGAAADGAGKQPAATAADKNKVDDKTASRNCVAAVKQRTAHMAGVQIDESSLQRLDSASGQSQYQLDFDAADPSGIALRFSAMCRVSASGTALVEIRPRRSETATPAPALSAPASPRQHADDGGDSKSVAPAQNPKAPASQDDDGWEVVE